MTINEILKSQGLTDEQVETIVGEMKQNKIFTASEENLDVRYGKLKTDSEAQKAELDKANGLIAELQKSAKGNEAMQSKITAYETEVTQLREELNKAKLEKAIEVGLLGAKALDVDYLAYKLREDGELTLDDDGHVKGLDDKIAGLKTRYPNQFEAEGAKRIEPNRIPEPKDNENGPTKQDVLKMPYAERNALYEKDPKAFTELMKG